MNEKLLQQLKPERVEVEIIRVEEPEEAEVEESELDEMWSDVGKKSNHRLRWHVIDYRTGQVLAYVLGRRHTQSFSNLRSYSSHLGLSVITPMGGELCVRNLPAKCHEIGKHKTQRIERKHLNLRTRIKRLAHQTICFSKTEEMHDARH